MVRTRKGAPCCCTLEIGRLDELVMRPFECLVFQTGEEEEYYQSWGPSEDYLGEGMWNLTVPGNRTPPPPS